jgi:hypothetical protein
MVCKTKKGKTDRMQNPWLKHLMSEKKKYPNKTYKEVMLIAKKSYSPLIKKK